MFEALLDRSIEEHRRAMLCAGTVAASVFNANPFRDPKEEAVSPILFVPDYRAKFRAEERREGQQSLDGMIKNIAAAMGCGPQKAN